ncbi:type III-A CRISPR-associated protein Csm2 [Tolypothrix sp. VBCCA 56010]|uniref:type III-A CRISPR-associated protein Csm2 n=1 Tax=Tolypothrix sp. VBCCA 56010 TaxID=3137731 RepID=UPI003D7EAF39
MNMPDITIVDQITLKIKSLQGGLKDYPIRDLVKHAEDFGPYLKQQRLETNQVRKFLDAVNQIKASLTQDDDENIKKIQEQAEAEKQKLQLNIKDNKEIDDKIRKIQTDADKRKDKLRFSKIETDIVLLKPKLAYAAARQRAAKPLSDVISDAIDKVYSKEDFERLVQLIESIIAYHKAEGGK